MELNYQKYPEQVTQSESDDKTPIVIIPGLFGSTANWRRFASELASDYVVYVIDQRNHGRSPHADTQTYEDMADDLLSFIDRHELDKVILCGHSMGGKTAMAFALLHSERVAKLLVLDIAPVVYQHTHAPFLEELLKIDLGVLGSRREADRALQSAIPDAATRLFLLQSLTGSPGQYYWRINLRVLHEFMTEIVGFPSSLDDLFSQVTSLFIIGELSDYVLPEHYPIIEKKFKSAQYAKIADAGHWLHADQHQLLLSTTREFLKL